MRSRAAERFPAPAIRSGFPRLIVRARGACLAWICLWSLCGCFLEPSLRTERIRREAFDLFTNGQDLEHRGDYTQALDFYCQAIDQSPRPAFFYQAGACHARMGHDEQALDYLDRALAMAPGYEQARAERDLIAQKVGLRKPARQSREQAAASPLFASPLAASAEVRVLPAADASTTAPASQASVAAASAVQSTVSSSAPPSSVPPTSFASSETSASAAAAPADSAPSASTPSTAAPNATVEIAKQPGPETEAEPGAEEIRKAIFPELFGNPPPAQAPSSSQSSIAQGWALNPKTADLVRLAEQSDRLDQAIFYMTKQVEAQPDSWPLRLKLARALARAGRLARAEAELKEAARLSPGNAELLYEWGGFYIRQEEWADAQRCYLECLQLDPSHAKARNNLGVIYLRLGQWALAQDEFEQTAKLHPEFSSAWLNLAIIEAQHRGRLEKAIAHLDAYIRLEGSRSAEAQRWRQELLLKRDKSPSPSSPPSPSSSSSMPPAIPSSSAAPAPQSALSPSLSSSPPERP